MNAEIPDTGVTHIQCVEYARGWLRSKMGLIYDEVEIAADLWDKISYYTRICDGSRLPVDNVVNGALRPPKIGDLLIYSEKFLDTGHVAVTREVDLHKGLVSVSEQNFANRYQPPEHRRHIPLITCAERYWLLDGFLIGWKQLAAATD